MTHSKKNILLLLLMSIFAGPFRAEADPPILALNVDETALFQEIPSVYGASTYEQKVTEAPSSISIVTADEIKKYGYKSLADILRSVRSFFITNDRNYSYVGVRGFNRPGDYNTRVLVLIDGHRTNDNVYDQAMIGMEFILDVDLIDRVEIIRGPGSSIYGSNAFFAVINVITKSGRDLRTLEASADAGSHYAYKARLSYGNRLQNGLEFIASGSYFDNPGADSLYFREFDSPATNNGRSEHSDFERAPSAFGKVSFHDFTLEGAYVARTKGIPTASFGMDFNNSSEKSLDAHTFADLKYDTNLARNWDITARLFYDAYTYHGDYIYNGVLNRDLTYGDWWGTEARITTRAIKRNTILAGIEYEDNIKQYQANFNVAPYFSYLDDMRRSSILAAYVQDEIRLLNNLSLTAGVRHDEYYNTFGGTTNPRFALIYTPVEKTIIKALYGTAFRAPNAFELYYSDVYGNYLSNTSLKPETIKTTELVYEQYFGDYVRQTAAGFYYIIHDLITQTSVPNPLSPGSTSSKFINSDKVEAWGAEYELEGKWPTGYDGRISYSYQNAVDRTTDSALTNSPKSLAKANLIAPLYGDKLFAGAEEQYTSRRKTLRGNFAGEFFITNLTLFGQNFIRGLEVSGSVYNLFNRKYGDPGAVQHIEDIIRQDGLTFRVKVTYAF